MTAKKKPSSQPKRDERQLALSALGKTITLLELTGPKRSATIIYLDNVSWRTISTRIIQDLGIREGQSYQPGSLRGHIFDAEKRYGMELALRLFSYRPRSRQEVVNKLLMKHISPEAIDWITRKLEDSGYLNDRAFLKAWINDRMELRGYGRHRIRNELIIKGIEVEKINEELDRLYPLDGEGHAARKLIQSRLSRYAGLDDLTARRRLTQFLLRRGFSATTAQSVIRELMPAMQTSPNVS
jgi:regulatory protein